MSFDHHDGPHIYTLSCKETIACNILHFSVHPTSSAWFYQSSAAFLEKAIIDFLKVSKQARDVAEGIRLVHLKKLLLVLPFLLARFNILTLILIQNALFLNNHIYQKFKLTRFCLNMN